MQIKGKKVCNSRFTKFMTHSLLKKYKSWTLEFFFWYGWPYFQLEPLPEILIIANLRHAESRIWTCAEPEFKLCWMKLHSGDNPFITPTPLCHNSYCLNNFIGSLFIYIIPSCDHDSHKLKTVSVKIPKDLWETWSHSCIK